MKRFLVAAAIIAATLSTPALATDVSINIGHPGFYGRLDLGGFPAPALLFPQPLMIERGPRARPPLYLRVPPGHARNWRRHCHAYGACGEQVYFVRDDWYTREYAPRYRERHGHRNDFDRGYRRDERHADFRRDDRHDRHDRHDRRDDYRRDERRDQRGDDRGRGRDDNNDRGPGHGRGRE